MQIATRSLTQGSNIPAQTSLRQDQCGAQEDQEDLHGADKKSGPGQKRDDSLDALCETEDGTGYRSESHSAVFTIVGKP